MKVSCAFSSCPNDTFVFDAWVNKKISSSVLPEPHIHDIQELNTLAQLQKYDVTKLSTFCFGKVCDTYQLLPVGAAVGTTTGPKLVIKKDKNFTDIESLRFAVPGFDTTAYLLLRLLYPKAKHFIPMRYDQVLAALDQNQADVGLIIHETRFVFEHAGFKEIQDLGGLYYQTFKAPLILGVFAAKRSLAPEIKNSVVDSIQRSILYAKSHPESPLEYMQNLSVEKDCSIIKKHVETFVTDETYQMSQASFDSLKRMFSIGKELNLLPEVSL